MLLCLILQRLLHPCRVKTELQSMSYLSLAPCYLSDLISALQPPYAVQSLLFSLPGHAFPLWPQGSHPYFLQVSIQTHLPGEAALPIPEYAVSLPIPAPNQALFIPLTIALNTHDIRYVSPLKLEFYEENNFILLTILSPALGTQNYSTSFE